MSRAKRHKYIFVIGGVMSGVGKGVATSSIGLVLQSKGFKVNPIKVDPYLNVDAGTMNPTEHGEVFVLDSGLETDQDMGNYERFMEIDLKSEDYITSGMVYRYVIERERALGYKGKCVEAIPHITEEIRRRIERAAEINGSQVSLIEIGGTVGDYQNILFIEAARVLKLRYPGDVLFILVTYLPVPSRLGEMKTKPTQNAVRQLNSYGVQPDIIIARSTHPLDGKRKEKLAIWCNVPSSSIVSAPDVESIYEVPLNFERDNLSQIILERLNLTSRIRRDALVLWRKLVLSMKNPKSEASIAIIGKYFDTGDFVLSDAYISVIEAIKHAAYKFGLKPNIHWLNSKRFETGEERVDSLKKYDGVIVPGGFGETGIEGKLKVIEYARKNKIPCLGLCYGMQLMCIEYARNVLGLKDANTTEINPDTPHKIIDIMPDQRKKLEEGNYGGSMRLGAYPCNLEPRTLAFSAYSDSKSYKLAAGSLKLISERHRHRFEVNPEYIGKLEAGGLVFSGKSPDGILMEIAEIPHKVHPFFLGAQFHPELKSRPLSPHPLFVEFIRTASKSKK
ncbi:MAG: CTP synthase [Candidatus Taylorbacteria bacterium RIFCSPHIGHO2_02_49_25]|uniref:CTP synthase n=1 Tax=Candidatus Taylorbacteria bacterium RIFCSPHIGHO2_02_49_25 TaxID=1802305 RepID=A0A1G2MG85_9BACT|nr:MAG: CTP synthetase [Parcubacteria group bacterium GW2011_GWF2_50_9]OHA20173.1 MAG: CTP synthase [Candidatus Taylorbacteria bacterium RIFCSPHIGHO2_01_FULL_49_60]OHA22012.1 MAG: CTP synthase [Candidatus Taylorbacteria bacterium RIFCSPHIGHO2_02_49_25]OHA36826.1 MAG: CTP synthase [Candidatus Taylorbacteria bacterium RIFCSPLOWO2_01_FULL_50_130]OHA41420.1 MAG: CTP synthase [Candidatus Taylorbacteria bacterium RIFCSPLOWO2_02_FULL_50_120]OHA48301.1 MAG: CTP synthase [Candidatus Taylorbacteria bact